MSWVADPRDAGVGMSGGYSARVKIGYRYREPPIGCVAGAAECLSQRGKPTEAPTRDVLIHCRRDALCG